MLKANPEIVASKRILYIEDESVIALAQITTLTKIGYDVTHVLNGEKALVAVDSGQCFELILSDINLGPGLSGPETARRILEKQDIPIIFMSAYSQKNMVDKIEKISNYGYVLKNSGEAILNQTIKGALQLFEVKQSLTQELTARKLAEAELVLAGNQEKLLNAELHKQATTDTLTGLPNKYALFTEIDLRLRSAKAPFYLVQINISNYGGVVSSFGEEVADEYLRQLALQVKQFIFNTMPSSFVARPTGYAGLSIIMDANEPKQVEAFSVAVSAMFKKYSAIENVEVSTSIFPAACLSTYGQNAPELMQKAMLTLQTAKKLATNVIQFYVPQMSIQRQTEIQLERKIALGLVRGEFIPYYQPQVSIVGKVVGYEVLARWKTADGPVQAPSVFLGPLGRMNLLEDLFESMLAQACAHLSTITDEQIKYSINISPVQFSDPTFVDNTIKIVKRYGLNPQRIKLEILEDVLTHQTTLDALRLLHTAGFSFAIDDYGLGYNNLLTVGALVSEGIIDTIKIARELVNVLIINDTLNKYEAVSSIIAMARKWNVSIIAEGVETSAELMALNNICNTAEVSPAPIEITIQGYYFSKPKPFEEIAALAKDVYKPKALMLLSKI